MTSTPNKDSKLSDNLILTRTKPSMSREQIKANLVAGLKKSGFNVASPLPSTKKAQS